MNLFLGMMACSTNIWSLVHRRRRFYLFVLFLFASRFASGAESFPVEITVDVSKGHGELNPIWRFFGADEPNYATMTNGRKLLGQLGALEHEKPIFFRTHNLLTSGDGTPALKWGSTGVYGEDGHGNPVYDWRILDGIFDTYLKNGVRPYVQIGFMPEALSIHPYPYQHHWEPGNSYGDIFTGWAYPPKDYVKWEELIYQWATHCIKRYGRSEVEKWWWEVWNEPNIPYWKGTSAEYHKLYDYAVAGVRRALPHARVGGPESTGPSDPKAAQFLREFLEHCLHGTNYVSGKIGSPLNFISFHAKGSPRVFEGHVRMGMTTELQDLDSGFGIVASYPDLKRLPIVVGECDPDGCAACSEESYPQNAYRDGPLYASYTAASFARANELAQKHGVNLEGTLTWAFEFEGQPWFAGFRALASNGVELPVLNTFRMMAKMRGEKLDVESTGAYPLNEMLERGVRGKPDVSAVASRDEKSIYVLVWHYHDDDTEGPEANVKLVLQHFENSTAPTLKRYCVDLQHGNAVAEWKRIGSPQKPSNAQMKQLENSAALVELNQSTAIEIKGTAATVSFTLPRQAVSLLVLQVKP